MLRNRSSISGFFWQCDASHFTSSFKLRHHQAASRPKPKIIPRIFTNRRRDIYLLVRKLCNSFTELKTFITTKLSKNKIVSCVVTSVSLEANSARLVLIETNCKT